MCMVPFRWPGLLVAAIHFAMPPVIDIHHIPVASVIATSFELLFVVWMVALMYHSFTVSCNLKGGKATLAFIAALLLAEALSKAVLLFVLPTSLMILKARYEI
jgi:hypothetical protein